MDNILTDNCKICWKRLKVENHDYCEVCLLRFFPDRKFTPKIVKKKVKKVEDSLNPLT